MRPHLCTQCHYRNSTYLGRDGLTASCDHPDLQPEGRDLTVTEFQAPDWCPLGLVEPIKQGRLIDLPENPTVELPVVDTLGKALAEWSVRGNMVHENKPDPRVPVLVVEGTQVADLDALLLLDRTAVYGDPSIIQDEAYNLDQNDPDFNLKVREAALQYEKDFQRMVNSEFDHARKEVYMASEPKSVSGFTERVDIPVTPLPEGSPPVGWVPQEGPNGETHWHRPSALTTKRENEIRHQGHYPPGSDVALLLSEIDALRERLAVQVSGPVPKAPKGKGQ